MTTRSRWSCPSSTRRTGSKSTVARLLDFVAALAPGSRLLFVDDGCRLTAEIVAKLIEGERMRSSFYMPHAGKGAAVAAGLGAATTEYDAGFCDVDLATPLA